MKKIDHLGIKDLPEDDKPREKMCRFGSHCLTDAELLAISIGTWTPDLTAIELSQQILKAFDNRLEALLTASVEELIGNRPLKALYQQRQLKLRQLLNLDDG
ncbi:UPF0758 domain-containing protein [Eubacterium aggregans]|uniref:UPF0758 domain-containing protein n=1 Tax=Eubacterium aggregans TaxID=81409 RepID=UPI003F317AAA